MAKTQDELTVSHFGSAKNIQDPLQYTRFPYRKHSTTLQYTLDPPTGLAEGGGLAASIIIFVTVTSLKWLPHPNVGVFNYSKSY